MILVKTPLRISFVGGFTDYEEFYKQYPGRVISTTIDKSVYIAISNKFGGDIRLSYSHTENVPTAKEVQHTRVRTVLEKLGIEKGVEIVSVADLPSKGIGLASSSAFTIGLLKGLKKFLGENSYPEYLARQAYEIEREEGAGKQDQYAIAHGGMNLIEFKPDGSVHLSPVRITPKYKREFERHLMFFYTNKSREGKSLLQESREKVKHNFETLKKISDSVPKFLNLLDNADYKGIGNLLHQMWELKKTLVDGISNQEIDKMYEIARANGAWGGKVMGAGGGGFLMLVVPPRHQDDVRRALKECQEIKIKFTNHGSEIVYETISETI